VPDIDLESAPPTLALTLEQEFLSTLLRAADALKRYFTVVIEPEGLTLAQFNVLRILRRAAPGGLPTLSIRDRMIERAPAITRLLDRLVARGWVARERDSDDRRVVHCRITDAGLAVLARLDGPIDAAGVEALSALDADTLADVVAALRRVQDTVDPGPSEG
jgi:DNA-binding MarR family transcriptional regulator